MFTSLQSVASSRAQYCTMYDRGDVWPSTAASEHVLHDFGGLAEGLLPGRLIATDSGWRPVETLKAGAMVLTFDHGMRRLERISTATVAPGANGAAAQHVMHVPKGAIGNRRDIDLLPDQLVLVDCAFGEAQFGDPFILVPAGLLDGYKGIARRWVTNIMTSYMLGFAAEEIVHTDGSALLSCFSVTRSARASQPCRYPRVTPTQAAHFRHWVRMQSNPTPGTMLEALAPSQTSSPTMAAAVLRH